ncbi:MAG TPA: hypothetical protein VNE62_09100 [Actinomycetota bacterium]|nr:hypothetical protein [Actinomycetota bacterium]
MIRQVWIHSQKVRFSLFRSSSRPARKPIALALVLLFVTPFSPARASEEVEITMSFFRYCREDVCTPDQFAYVKTEPPGPTLPPPADNPRGIVDVRPGDRIVWTYDDPLCDFNDGPGGGPSPILCPGHNVIFEDGSVTSPLMRARANPQDTFSWTVPTTATPGTKIRYYCEPLEIPHYQAGMTGILQIV